MGFTQNFKPCKNGLLRSWFFLLPNVNLSQDSLLGREILGTGTLDQLKRLALQFLDIEDWVVKERDSARYCHLRPETFLAELKSALCFIGLQHRHGFLFLGI